MLREHPSKSATDFDRSCRWWKPRDSVTADRASSYRMSVATDERALRDTSAVSSVASRARLEAIDVVRGVIMILMALDHTRDFFGIPGPSPTNLAQASAALFLTRWVTHVCAPVFFLLAGTGARLSLRRRSISDLSRFHCLEMDWCFRFQVSAFRSQIPLQSIVAAGSET